MPDYLKVSEVANELGYSELTIRRWIKWGPGGSPSDIRKPQLKAVRIGRNYRIRREDLNRFLAARSKQAG